MIAGLRFWIAGLVVVAAGIACAGLTPAAPSPAPITTIVAGTIRAITEQAPTPGPPTATATLIRPSPTASPTPVPATRITFLDGATTGVVSGQIGPGQILDYVLQAGQGQPMLLHVDSPQNDITLSIRTQGGTSLLGAAARQSSWKGTLPQTEDYAVSVYGGSSAEPFTLTVEIASRIVIAPGADSAKVSGQTAGGYTVAYAIFAQKGQKMQVAVYGAGQNPVVAMWGYADGKTYLSQSLNKTSLSMTIPDTQDYILEVIPKPGEVVRFAVILKIQ